MNEQIPANPAPEPVLQRLRDLSRGLLKLHKVLLDRERAKYEKAHGNVNSGELLNLVINHPQFAWLRSLSELIVEVDEMLDADEPLTTEDAESLLAQARKLLTPSETGSGFERKYYDALQNEPDAVLAHREVSLKLSDA